MSIEIRDSKMNHTEFCMLSHLTVSGRFYTQFLPTETKGKKDSKSCINSWPIRNPAPSVCPNIYLFWIGIEVPNVHSMENVVVDVNEVGTR